MASVFSVLARVSLATTLTLAAACDSETGPTGALDTSITVAPGDSIRVPGTSIRVTFVGVQGDSRCPADAVCIQGGDALVQLKVDEDGMVRTIELHTGNLQPVQVSGLTFRLEQLVPYPFSSRPPIAPDDYRATVHVSR